MNTFEDDFTTVDLHPLDDAELTDLVGGGEGFTVNVTQA